MSILTGIDISKSFGALDVLERLNFRVEASDRIGLVGPNGEGKTTLLRIIAGEEPPTEGRIHHKHALRIGYLPQDPPEPGDETLWQAMLRPFAELRRQESALQELMEQIGRGDHAAATLKRYGDLEEAFRLAGGYEYEVEIRRVLTGLGFGEAQFGQPLRQFSGGQRTRAYLAELILSRPELLLLDEPTNHLDLAALEWLESVLLNWSGEMIVVSHDRYFLDKVTNRIWELAFGELEIYRGHYSHYRQQRQERLLERRRRWEAQQQYIAQTEDFIRRNLAGQRTKEAQGRRTRLERFLREEAISRPREEKQIRLTLQAKQRSGDMVLSTHDLAIGYPDAPPLFLSPDLQLLRGERVAIIGANGSGKTTFLRTILAELPPQHGTIRLGSGVRPGYMAQLHTHLDPEMTLIDALLAIKNVPIEQARSLLGRFLFHGDDVFQPVKTLSGGQRSRLVLAQLALQKANLLLLDEPTNHLDLPSQEILQDVLARFEGTIVFVSHDRFLVQALATQVWWLEKGSLHVSRGGYDAYLADREKLLAIKAPQRRARNGARHHEARKLLRRQRKEQEKQAARFAALEEHIQRLETRLEALGAAISLAGQNQQLAEVQRLGDEYQRVEARLAQLMEEWAAEAE